MNDWQKDLDKKVEELKVGKEAPNVRTRSDSRNSNRINNRRISGSVRISTNKEINNAIAKGGNRMITVEGALKDLEAIEKEANDTGAKAIVKALKVVVKFLSTMRTNQLLTDEEKRAIAKARKERQAKEEPKV